MGAGVDLGCVAAGWAAIAMLVEMVALSTVCAAYACAAYACAAYACAAHAYACAAHAYATFAYAGAMGSRAGSSQSAIIVEEKWPVMISVTTELGLG